MNFVHILRNAKGSHMSENHQPLSNELPVNAESEVVLDRIIGSGVISLPHTRTDKMSPMSATPSELVTRCQTVLAHAWMVRTFVKHSSEVEDFPELMGIVRGVFDLSRAVETRAADPAEYFKMLDKKLPELRRAVEKFAIDAPLASTHTNFVQALISIRSSARELESLCAEGLRLTGSAKVPPSISKPIPRSSARPLPSESGSTPDSEAPPV